MAMDMDAAYRETFPDRAHAVTRSIRDGLERNPDASEAAVYVFSGHHDAPGKYVSIDVGFGESDVSRVIGMIIGSRVKQLFDKRALVHTYNIDSMTYSVEHRKNGEVRISCWDERCIEMDVRPDAGVAVSFQRRDRISPIAFSCCSDVHYSERSERLLVDMSGSTYIQIDFVDGCYRVCVTHRRTSYNFPYIAVCRAVTCILAAIEK